MDSMDVFILIIVFLCLAFGFTCGIWFENSYSDNFDVPFENRIISVDLSNENKVRLKLYGEMLAKEQLGLPLAEQK